MTVRPATINFVLPLGATFSETTILDDGDGTPIDLTGYSARMDIRRERDDAEPLFRLSSDALSPLQPSIALGGVDGTVSFSVAAATSGNALLQDPDGEAWVYDLLLTHPDGVTVDRMYQGQVFVWPGVTRP